MPLHAITIMTLSKHPSCFQDGQQANPKMHSSPRLQIFIQGVVKNLLFWVTESTDNFTVLKMITMHEKKHLSWENLQLEMSTTRWDDILSRLISESLCAQKERYGHKIIGAQWSNSNISSFIHRQLQQKVNFWSLKYFANSHCDESIIDGTGARVARLRLQIKTLKLTLQSLIKKKAMIYGVYYSNSASLDHRSLPSTCVILSPETYLVRGLWVGGQGWSSWGVPVRRDG